MPYGGLSNEDIIDRVLLGYRLPIPKDCPEEIYSLMLACWNEKPEDRPNFTTIYQTIEHARKAQRSVGSFTQVADEIEEMYVLDIEVEEVNAYNSVIFERTNSILLYN